MQPEGLCQWKFQWHHRESNPLPFGLWRSGSTSCATTCKGYSSNCIIIRDFSFSAIFTALSQKPHDFLKEVIEICVLIFSTPLAWNIFQSKKNRGRYSSPNARVAQLKTVSFRNEYCTWNCTYKCAWNLIFWKCLESNEFILFCCSSSTVDICMVYLCLTTLC